MASKTPIRAAGYGAEKEGHHDDHGHDAHAPHPVKLCLLKQLCI